MSVVHAVACDYALAPTSTQWGMRDSHPCPATSRHATTPAVLTEVAGRDGWHIDGDRHLCPAHAAMEATT